MHFEINVAHKGVHFFATHERSITTLEQCADVYKALVAAFPATAGYTITCRQVVQITNIVDITALAQAR